MNGQIIRLLAGTAVAAFLTACGGGGGGGGTPAPAPAPTPSAKKSTTVSGTVALVSLNSLVAKRAQKVSVRKAAGADAAQVSIRSYSKSDVELGKYTISTGSTGSFTQDVTLSDAGGYVVITATKPGYADFSKRVDYEKPAALNLRAELAKVTTGAGTPDATTPSIINIGVVRNLATGAKTVYSGAALKSARKAAGNQVELDMKINTAEIPGTTSVIGQFETFNATDPNQALYFPGAYRGTDKGSNTTGQLVSMAFDYIDLTTNQGKNVFKEVKKLAKAGKALKAASVVSKVTRWVPESSCENLFLQDGNPATAAWDVPIWSVDPYAGDGTWIKIGDGIVSTFNGSSYVPVDMANTTVAAAKTACKSSGYYVDITVTSPEYLEKWWNLDHMILSPEAPKEVCVTGRLVDQNNKPLTDVWLYMYDEDYNSDGTLKTGESGVQSFDYGYGATDSSGSFSLKSALMNNSDTDRSATISYYDPISYTYQEQAVTLGLSPNCGTKTITVTRPAVCTVNGTISGGSSSGDLVTFYNGGNDYYYAYTYTNSDGSFSSEVPCAKSLEVYVGDNWSSSALFSVDGAVGTFESSDNGQAAGSSVVLKTITKPNTPPSIWGYLDTYYATTGQSVMASISTWDSEGDYPVNYSISYISAVTGKPVIVASGSISKAQAEGYSYPPVQLSSFSTPGSYNLNIVATDSKGNTSMETPLGTLLVYDGTGNGGFAPSAWLYADHTLINTSDLGTPAGAVPLYAYTSDLDGAATISSYSWKVTYNGVDVTSSVLGTSLVLDPVYNWGSDGYITGTFTPPATAGGTTVANGGLFTIELTITDNSNNKATAAVDLNVGTIVTYPGTITIQKPALFKGR